MLSYTKRFIIYKLSKIYILFCLNLAPNCEDPDVDIENGRILLSRKKASLVCDKGYVKGDEETLECNSDGKWSNKTLYCRSKYGIMK